MIWLSKTFVTSKNKSGKKRCSAGSFSNRYGARKMLFYCSIGHSVLKQSLDGHLLVLDRWLGYESFRFSSKKNESWLFDCHFSQLIVLNLWSILLQNKQAWILSIVVWILKFWVYIRIPDRLIRMILSQSDGGKHRHLFPLIIVLKQIGRSTTKLNFELL